MEGVICYTTTIDMLQCKCYVAHKYNYCRPKIVDAEKSYMSFKGNKAPSYRTHSDKRTLCDK